MTIEQLRHGDPEVVDLVIERIHQMTREELAGAASPVPRLGRIVASTARGVGQRDRQGFESIQNGSCAGPPSPHCTSLMESRSLSAPSGHAAICGAMLGFPLGFPVGRHEQRALMNGGSGRSVRAGLVLQTWVAGGLDTLLPSAGDGHSASERATKCTVLH